MAIKQLMFDCDNTLIISEEVAFDACADLTNQILENHGIETRYTGDELIVDFVGLTFRNMMKHLQTKFGFTMTKEEVDYFVKEEEQEVIKHLRIKGEPCPGSMDVLEQLQKDSNYGLAVVSSSALRRIQVSLETTGQDKFFQPDHVFSAATSLPRPTPKPDPAVYLHAMQKMGVKPEEAVSVEDSKSGAVSAVRAGVKCIAYVGCYQGALKQAEVAETLLGVGCKSVMTDWSQFFNKLAEIEAGND